MGFIGKLLGSIGSAFKRDPLGSLGSITSLAMGIGAGRRQRKLMQEQDRINDENYAKQRADALADYERQLADQRALRDEDRQYNSIGAQMQRARDANVSPLAALGVSVNSSIGGVSPVSSSDPGSVSSTSNDSASHFGNAITLATTLKELKQRDKQLQIDKERADADNALKQEQKRKTEVERLTLEIEKAYKDDQEKARLKSMLADNDIKGVEMALKEQEHKQKEEMFEYDKRESDSRTKLNNAQAAKIGFEDWYQRTHHRSMSHGLAHAFDLFVEGLTGSDDVFFNGLKDVFGARGFVKGIKDKVFGFLSDKLPFLSDEAIAEYADSILDWLKTVKFRSIR